MPDNPFYVAPPDIAGSILRGTQIGQQLQQYKSMADLRKMTQGADFTSPEGRQKFTSAAMGVDPGMAAQYMELFDRMDERQKAQAKALSESVAKEMLRIKQLPPAQQATAYAMAQARYPDALKEPYDPSVIDMHIADAQTFDQAWEAYQKKSTQGPELKFYNRADGSQAAIWLWPNGQFTPATPGVVPGQPQAGSIQTQAIPDLPHGQRNNNPGNIVQSGIQWPGEVPTKDPRFESFETPEQGIAATTSNLYAYGKKYGLNTVAGIIGRWSPASENGAANTNSYTEFVAKKLGVRPDQKLDMNDPATLQALTGAIIEFENGAQPYNEDMLAQGVQLALGDQGQVIPASTSGPETAPTPPRKADFMVKDEISGKFVFDKNGYDMALKDYQAQADAYDRSAKTASDAAKAAAEAEKMTEGQAKDVSFAVRGRRANEQLSQYEQELLSSYQNVAGAVPLVGNYLTSSNYQMGQQAAAEFLAVILRKDTGAAVTPSEFATYGPIYLPQPGDAPEVVKAKAQARAIALSAIEQGAGPAGKKRIEEITKAATEAAKTTAAASSGGDPAKAAEILSRWGITP